MIELKFKKVYDNYNQQPCHKAGLKEYKYIVLLNNLAIFQITHYKKYYNQAKQKIQYSWWKISGGDAFNLFNNETYTSSKECIDVVIYFVQQWLKQDVEVVYEGEIKPCRANKTVLANLDRLLNSNEKENIELGIQINRGIRAYTDNYIESKIKNSKLTLGDKAILLELYLPKVPF